MYLASINKENKNKSVRDYNDEGAIKKGCKTPKRKSHLRHFLTKSV